MAKQTNLYLPTGFAAAGATVTNSSGTGWVAVYTAPADDATIKAVSAVSDDTAARNLKVGITLDSTTYLIGTVAIPAGSGTDGSAPAVDLLSPAALPFLACDRNGKRILPLPAGAVLKVAATAAVTSGKTLTVTAHGEIYG